MAFRAHYQIRQIENLVVILDADDGGLSVTNDAERVIEDLVGLGYAVDRKVIVYRDTMGRWDQMVTERGRFLTFRALHNPGDGLCHR